MAKRPGRKVDHSPPSSTKVKKQWSHTSTPAACLYAVNRDRLTFAFTLMQVSSKHQALVTFFYAPRSKTHDVPHVWSECVKENSHQCWESNPARPSCSLGTAPIKFSWLQFLEYITCYHY